MKIFPPNYKLNSYSKSTEAIINLLKKNSLVETIYLNVSTLDKDSHLVVLNNRKLVFIKDICIEEKELVVDMVKYVIFSLYDDFKKKIEYKVSTIIDEKNVCKFNFKCFFYFPLASISLFNQKANDLFYENTNFLANSNLNRINNFINEDCNGNFTDKELRSINFLFSPESNVLEEIEPSHKVNDLVIEVENDGVKKHIKNIILDEEQINMIYNINYGHHLILSCAGSGKSVVLLGRAMRLSVMNPNEKVLICCYNKNLAEAYKYKLYLSGFRNKNIEVRTFHKLLQEIAHELGLETSNLYTDNGEKISEIVDEVLLSTKLIENKYQSILIDEIQVFHEKWYKLVYSLLKSHDLSKYYFLISGDVSQNVNSSIKKGSAPWQIENLFNFKGRSTRINRNYRNTIEINDFIARFNMYARDFLQKKGITRSIFDADFYIKGESKRHGNIVKVIPVDQEKEIARVMSTISSLKDDDVSLSRIAILLPYTKYQSFNYAELLANELNEKNIPYSFISTLDERKPYYDWSGVRIGTIQSSLGLDFDHVIIAGINFLGKYHKSKFVLEGKNISSECEEDLVQSINLLYTGMSRAKETLTILIPKEKENIYNYLLVKVAIKLWREKYEQ